MKNVEESLLFLQNRTVIPDIILLDLNMQKNYWYRILVYPEKLLNSLFLKVHRSYIINVKKIIDIEDNSVLIKKDIVPVSRSKKSDLMKHLDLL